MARKRSNTAFQESTSRINYEHEIAEYMAGRVIMDDPETTYASISNVADAWLLRQVVHHEPTPDISPPAGESRETTSLPTSSHCVGIPPPSAPHGISTDAIINRDAIFASYSAWSLPSSRRSFVRSAAPSPSPTRAESVRVRGRSHIRGLLRAGSSQMRSGSHSYGTYRGLPSNGSPQYPARSVDMVEEDAETENSDELWMRKLEQLNEGEGTGMMGSRLFAFTPNETWEHELPPIPGTACVSSTGRLSNKLFALSSDQIWDQKLNSLSPGVLQPRSNRLFDLVRHLPLALRRNRQGQPVEVVAVRSLRNHHHNNNSSGISVAGFATQLTSLASLATDVAQRSHRLNFLLGYGGSCETHVVSGSGRRLTSTSDETWAPELDETEGTDFWERMDRHTSLVQSLPLAISHEGQIAGESAGRGRSSSTLSSIPPTQLFAHDDDIEHSERLKSFLESHALVDEDRLLAEPMAGGSERRRTSTPGEWLELFLGY